MHLPFRSAALAAVVLAALAQPLASQEMKAKLADDLDRLRGNVLMMLESMPAEGLRTAPTEGVRDFAEQIEHIASGTVGLVESGLDTDRVALGMDPEVYLNDKAELARFVDAAFDRVAEIVAGLSEADLHADGTFLGRFQRPKWVIVQAAVEHGVWTLGATVPYVRTAGSAPRGYNLVPGGAGGA